MPGPGLGLLFLTQDLVMGVAEGASADAPGVGLKLVSVSFSHEKKGEKIEVWRKKRGLKQKKKEMERKK